MSYGGLYGLRQEVDFPIMEVLLNGETREVCARAARRYFSDSFSNCRSVLFMAGDHVELWQRNSVPDENEASKNEKRNKQ